MDELRRRKESGEKVQIDDYLDDPNFLSWYDKTYGSTDTNAAHADYKNYDLDEKDDDNSQDSEESEEDMDMDDLEKTLKDMNDQMETQMRSISERISNNNKIIDTFHQNSQTTKSPSRIHEGSSKTYASFTPPVSSSGAQKFSPSMSNTSTPAVHKSPKLTVPSAGIPSRKNLRIHINTVLF